MGDFEVKISKVIFGSLGAIVILVLAQILGTIIPSTLHEIHVPAAVCNFLASALYLAFSYFLLKVFAEKVLKLTFKELGISKLRISLRWAVIGLVLPTVVTAVYFLFPGEFVLSDMDPEQILNAAVVGICFVGIAAGFVEEMVFRGVIMHLLEKKWCKTVAIIVPSVLFGLVHILGMDFSFLSCVLVIAAGTLAGMMFSLIALTENSVWNSGIVHALWNIITTSGILAVRSTADEYSVFTYVLKTDNFFLTGGEFGIESSLVAVIGYGIVAYLAFRCMKNWKKQD